MSKYIKTRRRKEIYARVLAVTGDPKAALIEAGYKPTKVNLDKMGGRMKADEGVQKRIMELIAEMYPVQKQASAIVQLAEAVVAEALASGKVTDLVAALNAISKLGGVGAEAKPAAPQQHIHQHLQLPGSSEAAGPRALSSPPVQVIESTALKLPSSGD